MSGGASRWWRGWFNRPHSQVARGLKRRIKSGVVLSPETGCHVWAATKPGKYAQLRLGVHRLAWELANGPIPKGYSVLHRCDDSRCCNPDHLFLGTQSENMADMSRKGRARNSYSPKLEARRSAVPRRPPRATPPQFHSSP